MSNAKIISLIAHETRLLRADDERARTALAADLYDALRAMIAPLHDEIEAIWQRLEQLERTNGQETTEGDQGAGSATDAQDQGREGQEHAEGAPATSAEPMSRTVEELLALFEEAGQITLGLTHMGQGAVVTLDDEEQSIVVESLRAQASDPE
jgi:hypothetical protein